MPCVSTTGTRHRLVFCFVFVLEAETELSSSLRIEDWLSARRDVVQESDYFSTLF